MNDVSRTAPSIYLLNPAADVPTYYGAEVYQDFGFAGAALVADLAITTVAALVPAGFGVRLCDERITPVDFEAPEPFVGITGKDGQVGRMIELARAFRERGKTVILGGPFASLSPEAVRPFCDVLVRGELESIAPKLFEDLSKGRWDAEYSGGVPDLSTSPLPRWDLYRNDRAAMGCVQTSRGCPFECEFCDVIQYVGRKQRHKSIEQVLRELDSLYAHGYRSVFLADDNFTVYRRRTRELAAALRDWNSRRDSGRMAFSTQVSIDIARDDDILGLCAEAGVNDVFIGIETPNEESLRETRKRQNAGIDLAEEIRRVVRHGIHVTAGMIVGFDSDGLDIFDRQYQFAMSTPVPIYNLSALVAPPSTPLYARLRDTGRLVGGGNVGGAPASSWETNIVPQQMTREQLREGLRWLVNRLYAPDAFEERTRQMIEEMPHGPIARDVGGRRTGNRTAVNEFLSVVRGLRRLGDAEAGVFRRLLAAAERKPAARAPVVIALFRYMQIRHLCRHADFWEPNLAALAPNSQFFNERSENVHQVP